MSHVSFGANFQSSSLCLVLCRVLVCLSARYDFCARNPYGYLQNEGIVTQEIHSMYGRYEKNMLGISESPQMCGGQVLTDKLTSLATSYFYYSLLKFSGIWNLRIGNSAVWCGIRD